LIMDVVSLCLNLVSVLLFCDVVCHMYLSKVSHRVDKTV
jgi:hypothetical protein